MSKLRPRKLPVVGCAACPLAGSDGDEWVPSCAFFEPPKALPSRLDADRARPRWCPLPVLIHGVKPGGG